MKFKFVFSLLVICLTFCSCNTNTSNTTVSSDTDSSNASSQGENNTDSKNRYSDIIGFIEEKDYFNAYKEFQRLTEEQRKNEYNPSDTQKALEEVEQKAYREENYDSMVKKVNITTNNLMKYFDLYSKPVLLTNENGNKFASMNYYLRLKDVYTLADVSRGYEMKIDLDFSYTETGRYYTIDTKNDKVTTGMPTASTTFSPRKRNYECELHNKFHLDSFGSYYSILSGDNVEYSDDYGKYMMVCENFIFTHAKGYLYLETD